MDEKSMLIAIAVIAAVTGIVDFFVNGGKDPDLYDDENQPKSCWDRAKEMWR